MLDRVGSSAAGRGRSWPSDHQHLAGGRSVLPKRVPRSIALVGQFVLLGLGAGLANAGGLRVETHAGFFNPTVGQQLQIRIRADEPLSAELWVVDRDGVPIRDLGTHAIDGELSIEWDGRDDAGTIVPDEAYSLRIVRPGGGQEVLYDSLSGHEPEASSLPDARYSRITATLGYELQVASRVHIQVGQAEVDPATRVVRGPVLMTLVDREPRAAGAVVETWSGWDEGRGVYIPDLPGFAIAIFASPLPTGTFITVGNRREEFVAYARRTRERPTAPRTLAADPHLHHRGLNVFEDRAPRLSIDRPTDAAVAHWQLDRRGDLRLVAALDADLAPYFLSQPTELHLFLGRELVVSQPCSVNPCAVTLPAEKLSPGRAHLVANWASKLGPVAVASRWVEIR
jgi:hypothetical protein